VPFHLLVLKIIIGFERKKQKPGLGSPPLKWP